MLHLLFALVLLPLGAIHFLPSIVAALRQGRNTLWIFLLNLFFGVDAGRLGRCADMGVPR